MFSVYMDDTTTPGIIIKIIPNISREVTELYKISIDTNTLKEELIHLFLF